MKFIHSMSAVSTWSWLILYKLSDELSPREKQITHVRERVSGRRRGDSQSISKRCVAGCKGEGRIWVQATKEVADFWNADQSLQRLVHH